MFFSAFFILSFASVKSSTIWWHNIVSSQIDCTVVVGIDFVSLLYSCARVMIVDKWRRRHRHRHNHKRVFYFIRSLIGQIFRLHEFDMLSTLYLLRVCASSRHMPNFVDIECENHCFQARHEYFILSLQIHCSVHTYVRQLSGEFWMGPHSISLGISKTLASIQPGTNFLSARARRNSQNDEFMMETAVDNMGCTIGMRAQI